MQRLFMGVAQTGVFACLDEFNKLEPEVLSVVAQQFMTLRVSLLQKKEDC
jgi:dynein heavy chain